MTKRRDQDQGLPPIARLTNSWRFACFAAFRKEPKTQDCRSPNLEREMQLDRRAESGNVGTGKGQDGKTLLASARIVDGIGREIETWLSKKEYVSWRRGYGDVSCTKEKRQTYESSRISNLDT